NLGGKHAERVRQEARGNSAKTIRPVSFRQRSRPATGKADRTILDRSQLEIPRRQHGLVSRFCVVCVEQAGATSAEFKFNPAHSQFVYAAIQNGLHSTGVFRAFSVESYAPQIGDIIQNNRGGNTFSFDYARTHRSYESHSAIVVETGVDSKGG